MSINSFQVIQVLSDYPAGRGGLFPMAELPEQEETRRRKGAGWAADGVSGHTLQSL